LLSSATQHFISFFNGGALLTAVYLIIENKFSVGGQASGNQVVYLENEVRGCK
jgi:hypothetical protein